MNPVYAFSAFLLALLMETVNPNPLFSDPRDRSVAGIEIKRKDFRKSNHIAHFMGKRTQNDIADLLDIPNEQEDVYPTPFQSEAMGYPSFINGNPLPFESRFEEKFPFRRNNAEIQVGHMFGREIPFDVLASLAEQSDNGLVSSSDLGPLATAERSLLEALLRADPENRERFIDLLIKEAMEKRRK